MVDPAIGDRRYLVIGSWYLAFRRNPSRWSRRISHAGIAFVRRRRRLRSSIFQPSILQSTLANRQLLSRSQWLNHVLEQRELLSGDEADFQPAEDVIHH